MVRQCNVLLAAWKAFTFFLFNNDMVSEKILINNTLDSPLRLSPFSVTAAWCGEKSDDRWRWLEQWPRAPCRMTGVWLAAPRRHVATSSCDSRTVACRRDLRSWPLEMIFFPCKLYRSMFTPTTVFWRNKNNSENSSCVIVTTAKTGRAIVMVI